MKYIFVTHSPITYLAALAVIAELKVDTSKCIIIGLGKSYETPINTIDFNSGLRRLSKFQKVCNLFNIPNLYDKYLKGIIENDSFVAYVPMMYPISRIIVTHPQCVGFHFIEEGTISYVIGRKFDFQSQDYRYDSWRSPFLSKRKFREIVSVLRGTNHKLLSLPLYYESYVNCSDIEFYGFSVFSFPAASHRIVLSMKDTVTSFGMLPKCSFEDNAILFISDDAVENYGFPLDKYLDLVNTGVIENLRLRNCGKIYIKSHPRERQNKIGKVDELFVNNGVEVEYISNDVILETEFCLSKPLILIGFDSTLLLYGALLGHESYCIERDLKRVGLGRIPAFEKFVKKI